MAIVLEAITHVWFAGRMIPPGEKFSADDEFGKKLIRGGTAKVAGGIAQHDELYEEVLQSFNKLQKEDLIALAKKRGVAITAGDKTKADIIHKLIDGGVGPNGENI